MQLSLHNGSSSGVTIISNIFIDYYMPCANGEFVKIYLYLLRCLKGGQTDLNLASVADVFNCTETDILRTLRYWEAQKLLVLAGTDSQASIDFLEPMVPAGASLPLAEQPAAPAPVPAAVSMPEAASTREPETQKNASSTPVKKKLSADRIRQLQENEEVRQMLFIAEQYMGTTLSRSVTDELLYIYEELHFSVDLIDYLIEYCVSKGSGDIHYIKKVAFNWFDSGIDSVTKAKQETTTYHRNYFTILKAFGITNRNPIPAEVNTINHWMKDYGFTMDILTEACARTVASTGKANFRYADKILSGWKEKGVRHLTDIQALDTLHRQLQTDRAEQKARKKSSSVNNFNNFQQRDYNYSDLESQLLK
ncbi:MAG: DnaD domain protein [Clostridiales bacterium]|nr:DnaD domain protein [Clostridiales bacterium]